IGIFQCLAFIPGTSRSGITMTVARFLGYELAAAARFSFLLSIPTIAAAGLYEGFKLLQTPEPQVMEQMGLMVICSAVTGFFAIAFMMYWLRRSGFGPFVLYRILLGVLVLYLSYSLPGGVEGLCQTLN